MDIIELKKKHGERMLSMAATEIVIQGLIYCRQHEEDHTPLGAQMASCMEDINSGSWDEIRAVIKRSL